MVFSQSVETFLPHNVIFIVKTGPGLERGSLVRRELREEFFRQVSRLSASQHFGKINDNILWGVLKTLFLCSTLFQKIS